MARSIALSEVWLGDGSVSRIDPRSLDIVKTIPVEGAPTEVTYGLGRVWVTSNES